MLQRIAAMVREGNPMARVLDEIDKMLAVIDREATADAEHKKFCESERAEGGSTLTEKSTQITRLEGDIVTLTDSIEDPVVGLLHEIEKFEDDLKTNGDAQSSETQHRRAENLEYQKEIASLDSAEGLLTSAAHVLERYYAQLSEDAPALVQVRRGREDLEPPSTWDDKYDGQSESGAEAIRMIQFLVDNTKKERFKVHEAEMLSQQAFEDSMQGLKSEEKALQKGLAEARSALSKAKESLSAKKEDLAVTTKEHATIEAYLAKIKPGCDFIEEHFERRDNTRASERTALRRTATLLRDSPAYKALAVA